MGWLFAVALGTQKQSGHVVWLSLLPIAAGHALAIGLVVAATALLGAVVPVSHWHNVRVFIHVLSRSFYETVRLGTISALGVSR